MTLHNPENIVCDKCPQICSSKATLKQHMILHNPKNIVCDVCTATFKHKSLLKQHIRLTHSESKAPCSSCGKLFSLSSISKHQKMCKMSEEEKQTKHACSSCGQLFSYNSISRHQRLCKMTEEEKNKHKLNNKVECKDCGKNLANKTKLNRHIRFVHNNEKLYQCNICDRQDYNKDNMKTHIKGVHKEMDPNTAFSNI